MYGEDVRLQSDSMVMYARMDNHVGVDTSNLSMDIVADHRGRYWSSGCLMFPVRNIN